MKTTSSASAVNPSFFMLGVADCATLSSEAKEISLDLECDFDASHIAVDNGIFTPFFVKPDVYNWCTQGSQDTESIAASLHWFVLHCYLKLHLMESLPRDFHTQPLHGNEQRAIRITEQHLDGKAYLLADWMP